MATKEKSMKNVGVKRKDSDMPVSTSSDRIDYPDLYLDNKQLSDIENVKIGQTITVHALAKVRSISDNENEGEKGKRRSVSLAIKRMAIKGGKKEDTSTLAKTRMKRRK